MAEPLSQVKHNIFDNGSEFKLHFTDSCESYGLEQKPITVWNPQANDILECIHTVLGDILRTSDIDMTDKINDEIIDNFIVNVAWAVCSTHHTVLQSPPSTVIFGQDMLFDIPYLADWIAIGQCRQKITDKMTACRNVKQTDWDYQPGVVTQWISASLDYGKIYFCLKSLPKPQPGLHTQTVQTPSYTFYRFRISGASMELLFGCDLLFWW